MSKLSSIKELKDWFFNLNIGREQSFSKLRKGKTTGMRMFKNGNIPDEEVFYKLLSSIAFLIDHEDRAKDSDSNTEADSSGVMKTVGGHVTVATDEEAIDRNNGDEGLYTRVPRTSQLTEVSENNVLNAIATDEENYTGKFIKVERDTSTTTHSNYRVKIDTLFLDFLEDAFESLHEKSNLIGSISEYYGTEQTLEGRWLICDGRTLGKVGSSADITGEEYKKLYIHLHILNGYTLTAINDRWDNFFTTAIPNLQGIFIKGAGSRVINGETYTGVLGQSNTDEIRAHSHALLKPYAYEANISGQAYDLAGSSFSGDGTNSRISFSSTDDTDLNNGSQTQPAHFCLNRIIRY